MGKNSFVEKISGCKNDNENVWKEYILSKWSPNVGMMRNRAWWTLRGVDGNLFIDCVILHGNVKTRRSNIGWKCWPVMANWWILSDVWTMIRRKGRLMVKSRRRCRAGKGCYFSDGILMETAIRVRGRAAIVLVHFTWGWRDDGFFDEFAFTITLLSVHSA